jgi:predicted solute-binding protein
MLHGPQRGLFELDFCLPSECADRVAAGDADIGIVPAIEVARQGLEIIPGSGIACHGAVRSILLLTKCAPERVRTLAVDSSSRSSIELARIILKHRYGAEPQVTPAAPDVSAMLSRADAALIIGDPALRLDPKRLSCAVLDLGDEWMELTGLPMVFAVWAGRPGAFSPELAEAFNESARFGSDHVEDIVRFEAPRRLIPEARAREYLTERIVIELGDREYAGMRAFLNYAGEFATVAFGGAG